MYCSKGCETRFNYPSRVTGNSNKKIYTKLRHAKVQREIIKWLIHNYHEQNRQGVFRLVTETRANEIYNELLEKAKTSMKEFDRIFIKPKGF